MLCPICSTDTLHDLTLENDLPVSQCRTCQGIFIASNQYQAWLRQHPAPLPDASEPTASQVDANIPTWDSDQAKLCPNCRHLLFRYRIWPDVAFYLDRCGSCNGVWLDKNEWQVLVARRAQDKINLFFTKPWQTRLRDEETRRKLEALYQKKFGAHDYARAKEIKAWLDSHAQKPMLLAFLQSDDPYTLK